MFPTSRLFQIFHALFKPLKYLKHWRQLKQLFGLIDIRTKLQPTLDLNDLEHKMNISKKPLAQIYIKLMRGSALAGAISFPLLVTTISALADQTVTSGTTVPQISLADGETLIVEQGGVISDPVNDAVIDTAGGTIYVENAGEINATLTDGIDATGATLGLINSGKITGDDTGVQATRTLYLYNSGSIFGGSNGVSSSTTIDDLVNSGTITGAFGVSGLGISNLKNYGSIRGITGDAIHATASISYIYNTGIIDGNDEGIEVLGALGNLVNSGVISGGDRGIYTHTDITNLVNSGTISATNFDGVVAGGRIDLLTNSGNISGTTGIRVSGALLQGSEIINSGIIEGTGGTAITFAGGNFNTIQLEAGSVLIGTVDFTGPNSILSFGKGLSSIITLSGTEPGMTNFTSPVNYSDGTTRAQGDASYLGALDDLLEGVSGSITTTVKTRLHAAKSSITNRNNDNDGFAYVNAEDTGEQNNSFWASGWFSAKSIGSTSSFAPTYYTAGGSVLGMDRTDVDGEVTGIYGGGGFGRFGVDVKRGQTIHTQNVYGGFYSQRNIGAGSLNINILGGRMSFDSNRAVEAENAEARYNGWFFAPTIGYEQELEIGEQQLLASGSIGYSGMFLEGYTESGSSSNLTVGARNIHQLNARGEISWLKYDASIAGHLINYAPYVGLEGRYNVGSNAATVGMLGNTATFDVGGSRSLARAFIGTKFDKAISETSQVFGRFEASHDTSNSAQFNAQIGFSVKF